jgi:hypothetical protein
MPSATSGRYQSRLFNFFHQQSQRWGEQFERTKRHLQVAASWSLEALLYPVYLLIQKATQSVGKQLHTSEQQRQLQLQGEPDSQLDTPPPTDAPIQRVLAVVMQLEDKGSREQGETQITSSSPSSPTMVQGVASLVVNRNLVLVTAKNEVLDILTPQQQEKLQNRIIDEVAKYWRSWQLNQVKYDPKFLSEIDQLLNKLTSGKNDRITALPQATKTQDLLLSFQGLALLDTALAEFESHAIVPISRTSGQLLAALQTQLDVFLYGQQVQSNTEQGALATDWEPPILKIQALIWGAVNYFFGKRNTTQFKQTTATHSQAQFPVDSNKKPQTARLPQRFPSSALLKNADLPSDKMTDSWLTMNDLFGEIPEITVVNQQQLVTSSQGKSLLSNSSSKKTNQFKTSNSKDAPRAYHAPSSQSQSESNQGKILQRRKTSQVEAKPDWIETHAQTIGYEKHPLEQVLQWLDRVILWLEGLFMNIVQFLRGLLRGK